MATNVINPAQTQLVVQNYFNLVQAIASKINRRDSLTNSASGTPAPRHDRKTAREIEQVKPKVFKTLPPQKQIAASDEPVPCGFCFWNRRLA